MLAFLPVWEVEIAFQALCTDWQALSVNDFIEYMDRTWINVTFKTEMWDVFVWDGP